MLMWNNKFSLPGLNNLVLDKRFLRKICSCVHKNIIGSHLLGVLECSDN